MAKPKLAYRWISAVLKYGSYLSLLMLLLGLMLLFLGSSVPPVTSKVQSLSLSGLSSGLCQFKMTAFLNLGLLIIMLTPILRVIVAMVSFVLEGDLKYSLIAGFVLLILIFSLLIAV